MLRLEAELDRSATDEEADRLAELDISLGELQAELTTTAGELAALGEGVADVTADVGLLLDAVTVLEEQLAAVGDELQAGLVALEAEQRDTAASLRSSLASVDGRVDRAESQLEELRTLIVTVRDRLDRCQADGTC